METVTAHHDPYLDQLAHLVAEHGVSGFEGDIARLVVRLRAAGLGGPLVDVLADRTAPTVARVRAFGILLCRLARVRCPDGAREPQLAVA